MSHGHATRSHGPVSPLAQYDRRDQGNVSDSDDSFRSATPVPPRAHPENPEDPNSDSDPEIDMDMAQPHLPKELCKTPQFRGDKSETGKAQTFLDHLDEYFGLYPGFSLDNVNGWRNRRACMRLNCFPPGSHAGIWYESALRSNLFDTYDTFRNAFKEHFGSSQSDLVAMQTQWNNVRQRPGDTVTTYYMHFSKIMSQLISLGHDVSKSEAMGRFQYGFLATLRDKVS